MTATAYDGVWTAIVTPFITNGDIDWPTYNNLIQNQVESGVSGIVSCGTTGEAPTLTAQEKLSLFKKTKALLPESVKLMAGTGTNNTAQSIEMSKLAEDAGADSILIVTPPYNKPSTEGMIQHFQAISESVKLPICLYHVPGRTAHTLTPEEIKLLTAIDKVEIVKEASANMALFSRMKNESSPKTTFLSGDDPTYLPSLILGGRGSISVTSNIYPKAFAKLTQAFFDKDTDLAQALHNTLLPFIDLMFLETNPCPLKAAMSIKGMCKNNFRLPLSKVTKQTYSIIEQMLPKIDAQLSELV